MFPLVVPDLDISIWAGDGHVQILEFTSGMMRQIWGELVFG